MKKVLFAGQYMTGFRKAWEERGYLVFNYNTERIKEASDENVEILRREIIQKDVEIVCSFDYIPSVAEACLCENIKYISWVWDCPHTSLWHKSSMYETTYIFAFDYEQYKTQIERGLPNVYYLPLSSDVDTFKSIIQKDKGMSYRKYSSDVAFLGNIYNDDKQGLFDKIQYLPPYVSGYLDALIDAQRDIWGYSLIENGIDTFIWGELKKYIKWDLGDKYDEGVYKPIMIDIINKKIAQIERREMCSYLARNFDFKLYSGADTSFDPMIQNMGYAVYDKEMPLVFNYSKINIHITVRSITSGIPLRVMDVLACGGFLLTNYQPEIVEYFENGKELVIYEDMQDLYKKIAYYLEHEDERRDIAVAGQKKVEKIFNYDIQVGKIIGAVEE